MVSDVNLDHYTAANKLSATPASVYAVLRSSVGVVRAEVEQGEGDSTGGNRAVGGIVPPKALQAHRMNPYG